MEKTCLRKEQNWEKGFTTRSLIAASFGGRLEQDAGASPPCSANQAFHDMQALHAVYIREPWRSEWHGLAAKCVRRTADTEASEVSEMSAIQSFDHTLSSCYGGHPRSWTSCKRALCRDGSTVCSAYAWTSQTIRALTSEVHSLWHCWWSQFGEKTSVSCLLAEFMHLVSCDTYLVEILPLAVMWKEGPQLSALGTNIT